MKIELNTDITVEIGNEEFIKISSRDLTKKEEDEFGVKLKKIIKASNRGMKLKRKIANIERKLDVVTSEEKVCKLVDELDALQDEAEKLQETFAEKGMDELEKLYEEKFELTISGDGKARLKEIALIRGFESLLTMISDEKKKEDEEGN